MQDSSSGKRQGAQKTGRESSAFQRIDETPSWPQKGSGLETTTKALPAPTTRSMKSLPCDSWCSGRGWNLTALDLNWV